MNGPTMLNVTVIACCGIQFDREYVRVYNTYIIISIVKFNWFKFKVLA